MDLFVLGTSQSVASTRTRERMHVEMDDVYETLGALRGDGRILSEAIPLATCGRLELYGVTRDVDRAVGVLGRLVMGSAGLSRGEFEENTYVLRGRDAARHVCRVASGLDSVVHGEAQILGQVRDAAHHRAVRELEGPVLHRLFQSALTAGKRVRSETLIGRGAASLASAALSMVQRELGDLRDVTALVLGAGDTGGLMARLLTKAGVARLIVANRTLEHARQVADPLAAEACDLEAVPARLADADLVVGAVTAGEYVITAGALRDVVPRAAWPAYFLDLGHPRSLDPTLAELDGVRVFDLEDVFRRVEAARETRAAEVPHAEAIVEEEVRTYMAWLRARANTPVLKAMRSSALDRARVEAERHAAKLPEEHQEQMHQLAYAVAKAILHQPTVILRGADPHSSEGRVLLENAKELFGIGEATRESEIQ